MKQQTDNGFTRITNELLNEIIRFDFSKREYKILLAIIRKTYGYNKTEDDLGLTQLAKLSGLHIANTAKTIKRLVDLHVIHRRDGVFAHIIWININYSLWGSHQNDYSQNDYSQNDYSQNDYEIYSQNDYRGIVVLTNTIDNPKRQPSKDTTTTTSKASATPFCGGGENLGTEPHGDDLIYPIELSKQEQQAAYNLLTQCNGQAQEILDALSAAIKAGEIKKSPLAFLGGMIRRQEVGTFDPTPGLHIATARAKQKRTQESINASIKKYQAETGVKSTAERIKPNEQINAMKQALKKAH